MKKFKFTISGNKYDVDIKSCEDNIAEIEVNGTSYSVELHKEIKKSKTPKLVRAKMPAPTPSENTVKQTGGGSGKGTPVNAPLPGSIFKMMVKEGDQVKEGDTLLIMEAMKMENNVLAEKTGTVVNIKVAVGDAVLQNDILLEIQ